MVESLLDRLTTGRIEIDMIQFRGIEFRSVDNRLMALKLVQLGLSGVAMFGPDGEVLQPSEVLRKRAILVERGSFRPPTWSTSTCSSRRWRSSRHDPAVADREVLRAHRADDGQPDATATGGTVDRRDFLARADLLAACGMTVLISRLRRVPPAGRLPRSAHRRPDRHGHGRPEPDRPVRREQLRRTCPAASWRASAGCSRTTCKLFVYPMLRDGEVMTVDTVRVEPSCSRCTTTSTRRGSFVDLDNYKPDYLPILSRDVLQADRGRRRVWETKVPSEVAELIKKSGFFDYHRPEA